MSKGEKGEEEGDEEAGEAGASDEGEARVLRLEGDCHGCGLCCRVVRHGLTYRCTSLVVTGDVGQPQATRYAQYAARVDGMPILMVAEVRVPGTPAFVLARCGKDSWDETLAILPISVRAVR